MELKSSLEIAGKFLTVLTDTCKFLVLAALSAFAIAAIAQPAWARQKLKDAGFIVKEINAFGVKLAADDAFDMAQSLSDAKLTLTSLKTGTEQASTMTEAPLTLALAEIEKVQKSLEKQNSKLRDVQESAGVVIPSIPETGWMYVGRITESNAFTAGPRIDAAATKLQGDRILALHIKADVPITENGDECLRKKLEDIHPPTDEELQSMKVLLSPNSKHSLDVVATATCPSIGNGKWLYAKVRIPKEDVKFVKFSKLINQ